MKTAKHAKPSKPLKLVKPVITDNLALSYTLLLYLQCVNHVSCCFSFFLSSVSSFFLSLSLPSFSSPLSLSLSMCLSSLSFFISSLSFISQSVCMSLSLFGYFSLFLSLLLSALAFVFIYPCIYLCLYRSEFFKADRSIYATRSVTCSAGLTKGHIGHVPQVLFRA